MNHRFDDFNGHADFASLGAPSDGGSNWQVLSGSWEYYQNKVYMPTGSSGVAVLDCGLSDAVTVATIATVSFVAGLAFHVVDANNYKSVYFFSGALTIQETVSGVTSVIGGPTAATLSDGDTLTVVTSGSNITVKINGTTAATATSSNLLTATKFGLYAVNAGPFYDNFDCTGSGAAATAVTQSGSLSGRNGMPNVITVGADGDLASPVTVTIAVTAGAATLNGTSATSINVTLPTGSNTKVAFYVQSPSTGNSTLQFTNNASLTNPGDQTYASAAGGILVSNANFFFAPGTFGDGAASLGANNIPTDSNVVALLSNGSYFDLTAGTTANLKLAIDTTRLVIAGIDTNLYPLLLYTVFDGSLWSPFTLTRLTANQTTVDFVSGGSSGTYRVRCWVAEDGGQHWDGEGTPSIPADAVVVRGMIVDSGATASTYTPRSKKAAFQGDSIVYGYLAPDAVRGHFVPLIAEAIDAEYDHKGFGDQNLAVAGDYAPTGLLTYNKYFNGKTKDLSVYDEIYGFYGTNGGDVAQSDVATYITNLRAAAPSAYIFMCVPPGGFGRAHILAAVAAAADSKVACLGSTFDTSGLNQNSHASFSSGDGLHPYAADDSRYAVAIAQDRKEFFMPGVSNVKSGVVYDGGSKTGTYSGGSGSGEIMIPIASSPVSVATGKTFAILQDVSTADQKVQEISFDVTAPADADVELQVCVRAGASGQIATIVETVQMIHSLLAGNHPVPRGTTSSFNCRVPAACDSVVIRGRHNASSSKTITTVGSLA